MNKKLITLAVAAAMAAPLAVSAETTLYGRLDTAIQYTDTEHSGEPEAWDVDTGTTRIGVKGSEDLGNGLSAIFQAEWQFTSSEGGSNDGTSTFLNRLAYAGLKGGFGTVTIGRQWSPYYGAVDKTDVFNNPGNNGTGTGLANANAYYMGPTRLGNAVAYSSPDFNGFSGQLAVVMERDNGAASTDAEGIDAWNAALNYNNGPISVGLSYLDSDNDITEEKLWGLGASYNFGMFKLIAQYENLDGDGYDEDSWSLAGEAYFGNNTVRLLYGEWDSDYSSDEETYGISLQHNFSNRTRVYAEYIINDYDDHDHEQFNLGLRHDF